MCRVDVSTSSKVLGFSQEPHDSLLPPAAPRGKTLTAKPKLNALDVPPWPVWKQGSLEEEKCTSSKSRWNFGNTDLKCPAWPHCPQKHWWRADPDEPSGTHRVLQWEERGAVFQQYCGQTTSSSSSQRNGLILLAKKPLHVYMRLFSHPPPVWMRNQGLLDMRQHMPDAEQSIRQMPPEGQKR